MKRWRRDGSNYWAIKLSPPSDLFQKVRDQNICYGAQPLPIGGKWVECSDYDYIRMLEDMCTAFGGNWQAMETRNSVLQTRIYELIDENKRLNNELLAGDLI